MDERDHRHPLLFLQRDSKPAFKLVEQENKRSGNTLTTSFWRLVETHGIPALGIVTGRNRDEHVFLFETFSNTHHVLTLITYIAVPGRVASATS